MRAEDRLAEDLFEAHQQATTAVGWNPSPLRWHQLGPKTQELWREYARRALVLVTQHATPSEN